jgi:hypothetical protein
MVVCGEMFPDPGAVAGFGEGGSPVACHRCPAWQVMCGMCGHGNSTLMNLKAINSSGSFGSRAKEGEQPEGPLTGNKLPYYKPSAVGVGSKAIYCLFVI